MVSNGGPTLQQAATKLKNIHHFKFCYRCLKIFLGGENFGGSEKNKDKANALSFSAHHQTMILYLII
jgi:hypothetical protein